MSEEFRPRPGIQKEFAEIDQKGANFKIRKLGTNIEVGKASLVENEIPFPHLTLLNVDIDVLEERGKGFASQLLDEVERISRQKQLPVILYDATMDHYKEQNEKAVHMYRKRRGWAPLLDERGVETGRYVYGAKDPTIFRELYKHYQ